MFVNILFDFSERVAYPPTKPPGCFLNQELQTIGIGPCFIEFIKRSELNLPFVLSFCEQFTLLKRDQVLKMLIIGLRTQDPALRSQILNTYDRMIGKRSGPIFRKAQPEINEPPALILRIGNGKELVVPAKRQFQGQILPEQIL